MSTLSSRGASELLEDAELELASIRAALALQSLERQLPHEADGPEGPALVPARVVDARGVDLKRIGHERIDKVQGEVGSSVAHPEPEPAQPRRPTLQERLASLERQER